MLCIRAVRTRSDAVRDRSSSTAHAAFSLLVTRTTLDRLEQVFPIPLEFCAVECRRSTASLVSEAGKGHASARRDSSEQLRAHLQCSP